MTDEANGLIGAVNALMSRKVVTTNDNTLTSSHDVSDSNSVLTLTRRDMVAAIGLDTMAARNVNGPNELPGDLTFTPGGGVGVFNPGDGVRPGGPGINVDGNWHPVVQISTNNNGLWTNGNCALASAVNYRSKSGSATLCGFEEYTSPSVPPKKYRTQTAAGTYFKCQSDGSGSKRTITGTYVYNSSTCATTNTQNEEQWGGPNPGDCTTGPFVSNTTLPNNFDGITLDVPHATIATTATQTSWTGPGPVGGGVTETGVLSKALTDEDLDSDAVARANVSLGFDNVPAQIASDGPGRAAGIFTFNYVYVEWQAEARGLVPGDNYSALATYGRRATGTTDPFVVFASDSINFTASGGTEVTPWTPIPSEEGFDTNVISVEICSL